MELIQTAMNLVKYSASEINQIEAGDKLEIKLKDGIEANKILDEIVPDDKKWEIFITVSIIETNL